MVSGAGLTVRVKSCATVPMAFVAWMHWRLHREIWFRTGAAGVPLMVPVPSPLSLKFSPEGRLSVKLSDGVGFPVVETVKELNSPAVKVALDGEVKATVLPTLSLKL